MLVWLLAGFLSGAGGSVATVSEGGGGGHRRPLAVVFHKPVLIPEVGEFEQDEAVAIIERAQEQRPRLSRRLEKAAQAVKETYKPPPEPTYQAMPLFDPLWEALMAQKRHEDAQALRAIAQFLRDEDDVITILF